MNRTQIKARSDTPILSVILGMTLILGGLPVLMVMGMKWEGSPQRYVAVGIGILTISLFALVKNKYEAVLIALLLFSQFQVSLFSIPLDEPALLQIFFTDILLVFFIAMAFERRESFRPDVVGWLFLSLTAWQAAAAFSSSAHLHRSLIFLLWQLKYLLVYLLVCNLALSDKLVRRIITVIFLIVLSQGGLAILQLITGSALGLVVFGEQDPSRLYYVKGGLRVSGTLGATNALAGYLAMLLVFALPFLLRWQGVFRYACYGTGFAALLFSLSRAGWLSFMVGGCIVMGGLLRAGILKQTRVMLLAFIGTLIIGTATGLYFDRIQERFVDKGAVDSAMGRFYQFEGAWPIIERYPVFGIGAGVTEYYGSWNKNERYVRNKLPDVALGNQPHNSQLQYWIESGTPALILFALIIVTAFATALRKPKVEEKVSDIALLQIGAGGAAVATMVHASLGTEINHHQIIMAFWILFALARNQNKDSTIPTSGPLPSEAR